MLTVTVREHDVIEIGSDIRIMVRPGRNGTVRVSIAAPLSIPISRVEAERHVEVPARDATARPEPEIIRRRPNDRRTG